MGKTIPFLTRAGVRQGHQDKMLPCFKNQMASSQHHSPLKMRERLEEKIFDVVQLRNSSGGSEPGNASVKDSTVGCIGPTLACTLFSDGKCLLT